MAISVNNTNITEVKVNGVTMNEVKVNGTLVFQRSIECTHMPAQFGAYRSDPNRNTYKAGCGAISNSWYAYRHAGHNPAGADTAFNGTDYWGDSWKTDGQTDNAIVFEWAGYFLPTGITLWGPGMGHEQSGYQPTTMNVMVSDDGSNWRSVYSSGIGNIGDSSQSWDWSASNAGKAYRWLRLYMTGNACLVREVAFRGTFYKTQGIDARYLRLRLNGSSANTGCHWVQVIALNASGANVLAGKVATMVQGGSGISNASRITNDNIDTADWAGVEGPPGEIQFDLGSVQHIESVHRWLYYGDSRRYKGERFQYSTDGLTWVTVMERGLEELGPVERREGYTYWLDSKQYMGFREWEHAYVPQMGGNTHGSFVASANDGGNAYLAFDRATAGAPSTANANGELVWQSHSSGGSWVQIKLDKPIRIWQYYIQIGNHSNAAGDAPKSWYLEGSNDGSSWITIDTRSNETGWGQHSSRSYSLSSHPGPYQYFRFRATSSNGGGWWRIAEFNIKEVSY